MLWNDTRAAAQAAAMDADPLWRAVTGNIVFPGFTAPKVEWVRDHEPDIFARIDKVLLPKDALRFWLTGDAVSEMSDAAGTSWLDTGARDWSDALLERSGLTRAQMPSLVEGSQVSGHLSGSIAAQLGLPAGIPVAGGGGDNAASAIGMGVVKPGQAFVSLGTSGVLFAATDRFAPNTEEAVHAFCHAVPGVWHQMGVILSAVDSLTWLGEITGRSGPELTGLLPSKLGGPSDALFLPYLSGERTPHNAPDASGALLNLRRDQGLPDLVHAVLDGVAFAFGDCVRALEAAGTNIEAAYAVGGGAQSRQWLEILAAVTGLRLLIPAAGDFGAAFGAADPA